MKLCSINVIRMDLQVLLYTHVKLVSIHAHMASMNPW